LRGRDAADSILIWPLVFFCSIASPISLTPSDSSGVAVQNISGDVCWVQNQKASWSELLSPPVRNFSQLPHVWFRFQLEGRLPYLPIKDFGTFFLTMCAGRCRRSPWCLPSFLWRCLLFQGSPFVVVFFLAKILTLLVQSLPNLFRGLVETRPDSCPFFAAAKLRRDTRPDELFPILLPSAVSGLPI